MNIETRVESERGCGFRKPGGLYMIGGGLGTPCGKLPIPLTVCPTCQQGIHATRGWTWVNGTKLIKRLTCRSNPCIEACPLALFPPPGMVGLIWIGTAYYATPQHFVSESARLGISRRIARVPRRFVLGETWVWVAHRQAVKARCPRGCVLELGNDTKCKKCDGNGFTYGPGVFHAFKPTRIEYVVKETDTLEKLEGLVSRGFTLVRVVKDTEAIPLFDAEHR